MAKDGTHRGGRRVRAGVARYPALQKVVWVEIITEDADGKHHPDATSRAPFDIIYSPDTRALVHGARRAQHDATPDSTGQTKKPAETGGLSLDVLSNNLIALVEGSSKSIVVELRGLEPLTPCMPCKCATSCAIAPNSAWFNLAVYQPSSILL